MSVTGFKGREKVSIDIDRSYGDCFFEIIRSTAGVIFEHKWKQNRDFIIEAFELYQTFVDGMIIKDQMMDRMDALVERTFKNVSPDSSLGSSNGTIELEPDG